MTARPSPRRSARLAPLPWSFNKRLLANKRKRLNVAARRALERPRLVGDALSPRAPEADATTRPRSRSGGRLRNLHASPYTTRRGAPLAAARGATRTVRTNSLVRNITSLGYPNVRTQAELQAALDAEMGATLAKLHKEVRVQRGRDRARALQAHPVVASLVRCPRRGWF